ncbi:hypothetical protein QJS10_CPB22g00161 [Acorus calamus]|uniref:LisH domain-containing protein n=1 Tax=Acorus calamus TaxID=4465 RepID=A0AAV9C2B4_ACOCL|nr:hypothetical protein QJS10_CPB22g00161 [Acorus calamus]
MPREQRREEGRRRRRRRRGGGGGGGGRVGDERVLLLRSIAAFLESNGFSRSLKRFRSEAGIGEIDTGKGQSLDLEHVFHKYIKKRGHPAAVDVECLKMQDKHLDKTSKKRRRLGIEESNSQFENETLTKKSKKRKSKDSENNVETELYTERSQVEEGHLGHDKKMKVEKFQEDLNKSLKVPLDDQTVGQIGDKEDQILERNNVNNTTDKRELVKPGKNEGKHSAEPKTVNPFQRVKVDEVKFSDERLQNNSYWAKGGADGGYGAKAQEILGQVKGRDFRHEKTKKKRGTYRGGIIDLQSHSIKFNYSDDD